MIILYAASEPFARLSMNAKNTTLSARFSDALIIAAMIDEMARADNWHSLDECLDFKPELAKNFARYADAALRAIRRMENDQQTA